MVVAYPTIVVEIELFVGATIVVQITLTHLLTFQSSFRPPYQRRLTNRCMEDKKLTRYRGVRPATLVRVCEGDGTEERPYEEVDYVIVHENVAGLTRQKTLGKVTWFDVPKSTNS